ncbi:MAG: DUF452 family protein [Candidatus Amulumruptor caecigallinarius]|nr:DUF452 family protein [Candidatus Amulumruptor caecigallinarius]MCM1397289.1 DUF452 family protein [Candidatus Amulumruptor caecigallinarius]MCM1453646.1 DUF452 family protein [bacterium]
MTVEQITHGNSRAFIIFAGWGMDANPFRELSLPGYDLYVAWGYDGDIPEPAHFRQYQEVGIVAWSYGVAAAARFIVNTTETLTLTARVAVNGVMKPVDDVVGMPRALYEGTLANISERSMYKFYRRMFASADRFRQFQTVLPERSTDSLRAELEAFGCFPDSHYPLTLFDRVYINPEDKIIPGRSQESCWESHPAVRELSGDHFPDFNKLLAVTYRNKELVKSRFERAAETYSGNATPQRVIAEKLLDRWRAFDSSTGTDILEFGVGTGYFTSLYRDIFSPARLFLTDIAAVSPDIRVCDAETAIIDFPGESLDVVAGASALQWFNSPQAFVKRAAGKLRSGGLMVMSTFSEGHFPELRPFQTTALPLPTASEALSWAVQANLEPLLVEEDAISIDFPSPKHLLEHLRLTGVNALGGSGRGLRTFLSDDSPARLTYRPIYLIFKKP